MECRGTRQPRQSDDRTVRKPRDLELHPATSARRPRCRRRSHADRHPKSLRNYYYYLFITPLRQHKIQSYRTHKHKHNAR